MKKILLLTSIAFATAVNATVFTVSNNTVLPGSPGQYTSVQAACNAALAGDTILVQGSSIGYNETVNIYKKLTIFGPGYNPQGTNQLKATGLDFVFQNASSNSLIEGFQTYFSCSNTNPITNITFRRNLVLYYCSLNSNVNGCIFEHNLSTNSIAINNALNVQIKNNIFSVNNAVRSSNSATLVIKNNLFTCTGMAFYTISNADIRNNIFYQSNPNDVGYTQVNSSVFNNNLTYDCSGAQGNIPNGSNVGANNIINQDPIFVAAATCGTLAADLYTFNYRLAATSPAKNAGTDGTDIGPTGGGNSIYIYPAPYRLTGEPAIPQMQTITIPISSVPAGGNLNITVKARKRN